MVSDFDELKARIWEIIDEVEGECDGVMKEAKMWQSELLEVSRGLGRCMGKSEEEEVLKGKIAGYLKRRWKVGKEMGEAVERVNEVRGKLDKLMRENLEVGMSGSIAEKVLIWSGIDSLDIMKVKLVSDKMEWLKGYGIGLMDFLKVWARERDEMGEEGGVDDGFKAVKMVLPQESMDVETVADAMRGYGLKHRYSKEPEFERDLLVWCRGEFGGRNVVSQYGVAKSRIDMVVGGVGIELKLARTASDLVRLRGQVEIYRSYFGKKLIVVVVLAGVEPAIVGEFERDMKKKGVVVIEMEYAA